MGVGARDEGRDGNSRMSVRERHREIEVTVPSRGQGRRGGVCEGTFGIPNGTQDALDVTVVSSSLSTLSPLTLRTRPFPPVLPVIGCCGSGLMFLIGRGRRSFPNAEVGDEARGPFAVAICRHCLLVGVLFIVA